MLAKIVGRRNLSLAQSWGKTGAAYGAAGGVMFLYFTDWKLILQYLPVYNSKYKESE